MGFGRPDETNDDGAAEAEGSADRVMNRGKPWWRHVPGVLLFALAGYGFGWLIADLWP